MKDKATCLSLWNVILCAFPQPAEGTTLELSKEGSGTALPDWIFLLHDGGLFVWVLPREAVTRWVRNSHDKFSATYLVPSLSIFNFFFTFYQRNCVLSALLNITLHCLGFMQPNEQPSVLLQAPQARTLSLEPWVVIPVSLHSAQSHVKILSFWTSTLRIHSHTCFLSFCQCWLVV